MSRVNSGQIANLVINKNECKFGYEEKIVINAKRVILWLRTKSSYIYNLVINTNLVVYMKTTGKVGRYGIKKQRGGSANEPNKENNILNMFISKLRA